MAVNDDDDDDDDDNNNNNNMFVFVLIGVELQNLDTEVQITDR
jgi:hypothetical protein